MSSPSHAVQVAGQGVVSADQLNTFLQYSSSFADARTFTGVDTMLLWIEGGSSINDGKQGAFYWNSAVTTDDGLNNLLPNGSSAGGWTRLTPYGGSIPGTTAGDNASAGSIGEYISSTLLVGSAISLTTGTAANVTSISLTAGDWDVLGNVAFALASTTTCTVAEAWTSSTSASAPTLPNSGGAVQLAGFTMTGTATVVLGIPSQRFNVSSTTTVYLTCQATFATSTATAYGFIGARRRR